MSKSRSELSSSAPLFRLSSSFLCLIISSYFSELRLRMSSYFFWLLVCCLVRGTGICPIFCRSYSAAAALVPLLIGGGRWIPAVICLVRSIISWTLRWRFSLRIRMLVSTSTRLRSSIAFFYHTLSSSSRLRSSISVWNLASSSFYFSSRRLYRAFFSCRSLLTRSRQASDFSLSWGVALFTGSCKLRGILSG